MLIPYDLTYKTNKQKNKVIDAENRLVARGKEWG